ncbi:uncharacterized protein LOC114283672 isoform X2 [Camellia sinensis]|uniref:uncharacterized protein LOC114283672 isoform X2 n=1 Tax=Camellia sinensis TaxID=4442 RepID=UPI001035988E|nr:uncharacterized protein LOC114283672 isoform X2 [Camellia sinensis]
MPCLGLFLIRPDATSSQVSTPWFLDSAATDHITDDLHQLNFYQPYAGTNQVTISNGSSLSIQHTDKGILPTPHYSFQLQHVLRVPSISSNFISVQIMAKDNNCSVTFDGTSFFIQDNHTNAILHRGVRAYGLYHFLHHPSSTSHTCHNSTTSPSASLWHKRLGHPSSHKFHVLKNHLPISINNDFISCNDCSVAKCHRLPFKLSNSTVNAPFALIHTNVCGPFTYSTSSYRFYVLFVNDFSRFTWLFPLSCKSEVCSKFKEFKMFVENNLVIPSKF